MNWDDIRYIMAIYRTGTLTRASIKLDVNQTTVSRRLKLIEDKLGKTLFLRSGAEMIPTDVCTQIVQPTFVGPLVKLGFPCLLHRG